MACACKDCSSSPSCPTKDSAEVAPEDLRGFIGIESAVQHGIDQHTEICVVLKQARGHLLVRADADVIHADDIDHFLDAVDHSLDSREEVPQPNPPAPEWLSSR